MEAVSRILAAQTIAPVTTDLGSVLAPGQSIQAKVQQILADGLYRLTSPRGAVDVQSPTPLPVGQTVTLSLTRTDGGTVLRIALPLASGGNASAPAPSSPQTATSAPSSAPSAALGTVAPQASAARPPGSPVNVVVSLATAAATVAPGAAAGGASPALATSIPPAATAATTPAAAGASPTSAVSAGAPAAAPAAGTRPPADPSPGLPGGSARPVPGGAPPSASTNPLFQAIASSLRQQDGFGPLIANLAALAARPRGEVPAPVRTAAERLAGLRLDASRGVSVAALKSALESSGVFFEARLARGDVAGPNSDLKALLLALRDDLAGLFPADGNAEPVANQPRADRPAPPLRGEPPSAQKAALPATLPTAPDDVAKVLLGQTESSLARLRLAQVASMPPEQIVGQAVRPDGPAQSLHATIPLGLGRETALLDLVVERDPEQQHGARAAPIPPLWRVWLALDIEPTGPVTALVTLGGAERAVGVTFWAEREATEQALAAALPGLRTALTAAELTVGETVTRNGRPRRAVRAGRYLDKTT
jgi:hypothetical protein